jgi:hypothetical protein
MKVLLETVGQMEETENAYINFHSRLIISVVIVWLVCGVWGREERQYGEKRNMCPHLLAKLYGHCECFFFFFFLQFQPICTTRIIMYTAIQTLHLL